MSLVERAECPSHCDVGHGSHRRVVVISRCRKRMRPCQQRRETDMNTEIRELDTTDLDAVSGGMKWSPVKNDDVIDARGGQFSVFGWTFTLDVGGKISSVTH